MKPAKKTDGNGDEKMKAVILAAGKGVRMKPLTDDKPKALVELRGKPLVEYALDACKNAGIEKVALVVGYLGEQVKKKYGSDFNGMPLTYITQHEQLGTAHAIGLCRHFARDDFLAINCDVVFGKGLLEELMKVEGFDAVVVARKDKEPWKFGCLKSEGKKLVEIVEKPACGREPSKLVNAGVYRFGHKIFGAIDETRKSARGEYEITDAINLLAGKGRAGFMEYGGKIEDIGELADLSKKNNP